MPEMLNRSRVFVAPLQSGAGIQNKVLEAMACGLPVVSTAYGNGGIQARNGDEILLADTAHEFATCVLRLLADIEFAGRLGTAARELVTSRFGWEAKVSRLDDIFRRISSRPHTSPLPPISVRPAG
jgi:glycosyltransferase involved in cell wall biosynthesis